MARKTTPPRTRPAGALGRYTVTRLDQVRLLAHPLRLRLFEMFVLEPRTTQQVAKLLGVAPTRLYHHVNALERVGLLQLTETRQVRGATEKYYRAVGRMLEVEPGLFAGAAGGAGGRAAAGAAGSAERGALSPGDAEAMVGRLLEGAGQDLAGALRRYAETPEALRPVAARVIVHGSPAKITALRRRVARWLKELSRPRKRAGKARKTRGGAARGTSRASVTLIFTADPGSRPSGSD